MSGQLLGWCRQCAGPAKPPAVPAQKSQLWSKERKGKGGGRGEGEGAHEAFSRMKSGNKNQEPQNLRYLECYNHRTIELSNI